MGTLKKIHAAASRIIILAYAAATLAGLTAFLAVKSTSMTAPVGKVPEKTEGKLINLAHFKNHAWVEASSYAWLYIHHPLFVIDGLNRPPSNKEEWVPDRRTDDAPFFTVHLGRPADVKEVIVYHEGRYSKRFYTISCLHGDRVLDVLESKSTKDVRVVYTFDCKSADAVRLDFTWDPFDSEGHIRIHEIEVMGI
ncbi:MAG: hypothetical protein ABIJ56_08785 [Pseudomonadota bacterium]